MRTAIIFEKRVVRGDIVKSTARGYTDYPKYQWLVVPSANKNMHVVGTFFLPTGTYTVSAETVHNDTGVRVYTYTDRTAAGKFPDEGWGTLPYTFTLTEVREVVVDFYREDGLETGDVTNVRIHDTQNPGAEDIYAQAVMHPEEIADVCTIKNEINCITGVSLRIFPGMEAWRFCERSVTYVRVFDLDRTSDRMIMRGRVTAVTDRMERGGKMYQDVTCASALDFLRDTEQDGYIGENIAPWLMGFFKDHDDKMDDGENRKLIYSTAAMQNNYYVNSPAIFCTKYEALTKMLTSGENLKKYVGQGVHEASYKLEMRERYVNDLNYIDIAESFGEKKNTPIKLGENLAEIQIERNTDGGIYTAVTVVSGTNSDGGRFWYTRTNPAMAVEFGTGRTKVITADNIRCTAPMYEWVDHGDYMVYEQTEANRAMVQAVQALAAEEAAKLAAPPARITLTAADLAKAGMTGYEPFECYNSYPLVHPDFYLHGQYVRVYEITRRLSDGKIESMTIGTGEQPPSKGSSMSALLARLDEANRKTAEKMQEQLELVDAQIEEQTGGTKIKPYTKNLFNKLPEKDETTLYIVDDGTDVALWYGDRHISTGGGEGQTIECAAVLTSEQMTEWAPDHELVPVSFRGSASVYYGQPPARFVVQGQRAVFSRTAASEFIADDITSEIVLDLPGGYREKYVAALKEMWISGLITIEIAVYDVSGAAEILIGKETASSYTSISFNSRKVGLILSCNGWVQGASTGHLAPQLQIVAAVATDGVVSSFAMGLPSGSHFSNPVPLSVAEEGFGTAISRKTEPSTPDAGGEGE